MALHGSLIPQRNIALFLDVDGTLLEIAKTPNDVKVPAALRNTLQLARARDGGALALISGRAIVELDQLFAPNVFAAAGLHGLERRSFRGQVTRPHVDSELLNPSRERLNQLTTQYRGLLLEDKGTALALHFRLAPEREAIVQASMAELMTNLSDGFTLRKGKCVLEITPTGYTKGTAIEAFMKEEPFAGRTPVFIGDDVTDEDGFDAVNAMHGYSIRVGHPAKTSAKFNFGSESAVVAWLRERNVNPRD